MMKSKKIPMWRRLGLPGPIRQWVNGKRTCPYRLYRIWLYILWRTSHSPGFRRLKDFKYYAHVTLCDEWRNFEAFWFWAHLTGYRDDLSIDRIDGRKGYCPENCRWATHSEQMKNRHYTDAFREACRRNWLKAMAAIEARRNARK